MKIEAIKHKDVYGKEQTYIKITNNMGKEHVITVGTKTYDKVKALNDEEQNTPTTTTKPVK